MATKNTKNKKKGMKPYARSTRLIFGYVPYLLIVFFVFFVAIPYSGFR